jgi:hypothetical protein
MKRAALTATAVGVLALAGPAQAIVVEVPRITRPDARQAARDFFAAYTGANGQRVTIAPCTPAGKRARVCAVRIGAHERWRVTARYAGPNLAPFARARKLPDR